jgi:hypothetical protein
MSSQEEGKRKRGRPPLSEEDRLSRKEKLRSERLSVALSASEKAEVAQLSELLGGLSTSATFNYAVRATLATEKRRRVLRQWADELQSMALFTAQDFASWKQGRAGGSRLLRDFLEETLKAGRVPLFCLELPTMQIDGLAVSATSYSGSSLYDTAIESYCDAELRRQEALAKALETKAVPFQMAEGGVVLGWKSPLPARLCRVFFVAGITAREADATEALAAREGLYCYAETVALRSGSFAQPLRHVGSKEEDA